MPVTKLGRLVKDGKIKSLEEIYLFSIAVKEAEIIDYFLGESLKDEVVQLSPVQKQTQVRQRTAQSEAARRTTQHDRSGDCTCAVR